MSIPVRFLALCGKIPSTVYLCANDCFCIALFSTLEQAHCAFIVCDSKWVTVAFYSVSWTSTEVVYIQSCLDVTWLVACETAAISAHSVHTIQPCTTSCHFKQNHKCSVHACLAVSVTCHLHFWQNDWYLLCATAVRCGWKGYHNKLRVSTESWLWRKRFCRSCWDSNPWPFNHKSSVLTTELCLLPTSVSNGITALLPVYAHFVCNGLVISIIHSIQHTRIGCKQITGTENIEVTFNEVFNLCCEFVCSWTQPPNLFTKSLRVLALWWEIVKWSVHQLW